MIDPPTSAVTPKVSVVMTTFNHERFIEAAIEGVLRQETTFPCELIIGEDCSTDGTGDIVDSFQRRHPDRVRRVRPDQNVGGNALYRQVLEVASGEYLALIDGDDYWVSPNKLERQVRTLDAQSELAMVFHNAAIIEEDSHRQPRRYVTADGPQVFALGDILKANFVPYSSAVVRRTAIQSLPSWATAHLATDWLTWIHVAHSGLIGYIDEMMGVYRVHGDGMWGRLDRTEQIEEEHATHTHLNEVVAASYAPICKLRIAQCQIQLAVERLRLPYCHPIFVVGPPPVHPWYFNGRNVHADWQGRRLVEELERLRRGTASPILPDYAPADSPREDAVVSVIIPTGAESWIDDGDRVRDYLKAYPVSWSDERCQIFELPMSSAGPDRRVDSARNHEPMPQALVGRHLDRPVVGGTTRNGGVDISGWVIGRDQRVVSVRASSAGEILREVRVGVQRPDVADALPNAVGAATSGFHLWADLASLPMEGGELSVDAVLENGETAPLGRIVATG